MTAPRFAREDYELQVRELTSRADFPTVAPRNPAEGTVIVPANRLRLWAVLLAEAAERAPTHAELLARTGEVPS